MFEDIFEDMSHDRFSQLTSIIVDLIHNNWNIQHPLLANNGDMEREEVTATNCRRMIVMTELIMQTEISVRR